MCSDRRRNHGCGQKKKQKELALLCLALGPPPNAANSSNVPTEFAAELKKEKVLKDKFRFVTWTFRLPLLQYRYWLFFLKLKTVRTIVLLPFVVFAKTRVTMWFRSKNAGYSTGLSQVCATSFWLPCGADGRMDGRSRDYYVTINISWLDSR